MSLDDLKRPKPTLVEVVFEEPTSKIWMKINIYYQRQNVGQRFQFLAILGIMPIFARVPQKSSVKRQWGCRRRHLWLIIQDIGGYFFVNFGDQDKHYYMAIRNLLPVCNWFQNEWPRMTLNGYIMSNSDFVPAVLFFLEKCSSLLLSCILPCLLLPSLPLSRFLPVPYPTFP